MEEYPKIDGYNILGTIGEGGMGCVYKATQISMDRFVAIKIVPNNEDKKYLHRFSREAKAVAALNHPNIVKAIDHGQNDKVHYFIMEYIDGINLNKKITKYGRILEREALDIVLQVANALSHAHKNQIIHRDIKPDNIMLNIEGRILLCDLGLAKNHASRSTQKGEILGTPHYMSPEQCRGEKEVDTRSDIYSLGITLYHMVTGEVPFEAPHLAAVCMKHISENMPDPREKVSELTQGLVELIHKMTAKKPEDRFQNPKELIVAIKSLLQNATANSKSFTSAKTVKFNTERRVNSKDNTASISQTKNLGKTKRARRVNRSMRTSSIQSAKSKSAPSNTNIIILAVICLLAAVILLLVTKKGETVTDDIQYSYLKDIQKLQENQDLSGLSEKIKEFKKTEYYQYNDEIETLDQQLFLYYEKKAVIEKSAGELNFDTAFALIISLKETLSSALFSNEIDKIYRNVTDVEKLKFETLKQNVAGNINELKKFHSKTYREQINNLILEYEQKLANKESIEKQKNNNENTENDYNKNNNENKQQESIDPQIEIFVKNVEEAITLLNQNSILLGIEKFKNAINEIDKNKHNVSSLIFPGARSVTKFEENLAAVWVKLWELEQESLLNSLARISKILDVYFALSDLNDLSIIEKPDIKTKLDNFWEKQRESINKQDFERVTFTTIVSFFEKEYTRLEKIEDKYAFNLLLGTYTILLEKLEKLANKRQNLSWEEFENIVDSYNELFILKKATIDNAPELKELAITLGNSISGKLIEKIDKEMNSRENLEEVQRICLKTSEILSGETGKVYLKKRNEARILELILTNNKKNEYFYNFDNKDSHESIDDWQLVSLSGKKRSDTFLGDKFVEVPVNSILFWKYPMTSNCKVEIKVFNPSNNNVRRNSKLVRWAENFGIVAFREQDTSLLFLFNYHKHLNLVVKFKPKEEGYNRFSFPLAQSTKEFPYNDRQPAIFTMITQLHPIVLKIQGKDVNAEESLQPLSGKFFIGIINIPTSKDSSLAIQQIKISNCNFYTEDYLKERELDLISK